MSRVLYRQLIQLSQLCIHELVRKFGIAVIVGATAPPISIGIAIRPLIVAQQNQDRFGCGGCLEMDGDLSVLSRIDSGRCTATLQFPKNYFRRCFRRRADFRISFIRNRPDAQCGPALPTGDSRWPFRTATPPSGTTALIVERCLRPALLMPWPRPSRNHCPGHSVTRSSSISIIVTHSSVHAGIESSSSPGGGRFINAHTHYRNHETQLVLAGGGLNLSRNLTTTRRDLPPNGCASAQPSPSSGCGRTNRLPNGAARQLCDVALRRLVWRQPFPHRRIRTVGHSEHASRYDSARQPGQGSPPAGPRAQARRGSPRMDRCRGGRSRLREPPCMRPGARPE